MTVKFQISGIGKTKTFLNLKKKQIGVNLAVGLKKATGVLKKEIESSIEGNKAEPRSIDTGEFRKSIKTTNTKDTGTVSSNVKQSAYMEYGTSKIKERRHFRNSVARKTSEIKNILKDSIK